MRPTANDVLYVRIDRARKLPITVLLRALGYGTDAEIVDLLGEDERLMRHHRSAATAPRASRSGPD